jgi:hypothetical protein
LKNVKEIAECELPCGSHYNAFELWFLHGFNIYNLPSIQKIRVKSIRQETENKRYCSFSFYYLVLKIDDKPD